MSRTKRGTPWTRCYDHHCEWCGQGKSRRTYNRKQRHTIRRNINRQAWWLT